LQCTLLFFDSYNASAMKVCQLTILFSLAGAMLLHGSTLGIAADYNVFVLNKFSPTCCDTGGAVAAGNNVIISSGYAVDQARVQSLQADYTPAYGLVVGGTTSEGSSTGLHLIVDAGNAYEHTNSGLIQFQSGSDPNGILTTGGTSPIDFGTAAMSLQSQSTFLASQANTVAVTNDPNGGLDIVASGAGTTFATLTAAQIAANALHITVNSTQTLVINVKGTSASTSNSGIYVNGSQLSGDSATAAERILFNFTGTTFTLNETFSGSLLAPYATVQGSNNQQLQGNLVANNFTGNTEFHDLLFTGTLPQTPTTTPEPVSLALMSSGLLGFGWLFKKRGS
jgi:choice-of-anchor A domain-containing protein